MNSNCLLNVKSAYSLLSSLIKIEDYISFAQEQNYQVLSLVDDVTMYGTYEFYKSCVRNGIKPIIGLSFRVVLSGLVVEAALLAKDYEGYQQLMRLSSTLMCRKNKEVIWDELSAYRTGNVLILSPGADQWPATRNVFETDPFYWGINHENRDFYQTLPAHYKSWAVWFNDVRYLHPRQGNAYRMLAAIKAQTTLSDELRLANNFFDTEIFDSQLIRNNEALIQQLNVEIHQQDYKNTLLHYPTPSGVSAQSYLQGLCLAGWKQRFAKQKINGAVYEQRLRYELDVIHQMGFDDYFLIVYDYVNQARKLNIYVGPGRGSAAGSLVSYLLHITDVDPIAYNLLFERFLNPERKSMPDIDIDFEDVHREKIVEYLFEKYGADHVAHIVTYQTIGLKMAIRDLCRVHGIELSEADKMAKLVDVQFNFDLAAALRNNQQLQFYANKYEMIFANIEHFIGLPRQVGTHAAGVVLSQQPLATIIPIQEGYNGIYQTQYSMEYLEELGLIKFDLLGLRNLTILHAIVDDVNHNREIPLQLSQIPLTDGPTFQLLQQGRTSGIFQLESPGMTNVLVEMKASSLEDIAATSSLFRPGPQENIPLYIARKEHRAAVESPDHRLDQILQPTYGIIVYQEQVMLIAQEVAKFSLGKADILRRAMGKKDYTVMNSVKDEFIRGAEQNGYTPEQSNAIWNLIDRFASYGFNRSHAICYSLIGYWMAYFKANFLSSFLSALLTSVIGNDGKTNQYLQEARDNAINVVAPNINNGIGIYHGDDQHIYLPLLVIKQIGYAFFKNIQQELYSPRAKFQDLFDLFERLTNQGLNKKTYEALCYGGALDAFGPNRDALFDNYERLSRYLTLISYQQDGQWRYDEQLSQRPSLSTIAGNEIMIINKEQEFLGFYLSNHPIAFLRKQHRLEKNTVPIRNLTVGGVNPNVVGVIVRVRNVVDKNNRTMAFFDLTDDTGTISITCFANLYETYRDVIKTNQLVILNVKLDMYKNQIRGVMNKIKVLTNDEEK